MRLVEVVVLMGSQCVSPLQHAPNHTVAFQVPCAVLIERDESSGQIAVKPKTQAYSPHVLKALKRHDGAAPAPDIVALLPQAVEAPRGSLTSDLAEAAPPEKAAEPIIEQAEAAQEPAVEPVGDASEQAAANDQGTDENTGAGTEPEKTPPPKASTSSKKKAKSKRPSSLCKGSAKPKWYTNAQGRRKYRCVKGGSLPVY